MTLADLGIDLRAWRHDLLLSQADVSRGARVSLNTVRRAEAGGRISLDSIELLRRYVDRTTASRRLQLQAVAARVIDACRTAEVLARSEAIVRRIVELEFDFGGFPGGPPS